MSSRSYYPFLDGFRTFAMLWVFMHHLNARFDLGHLFRKDVFNNFDRWADIGNLGVDIFFVISGFLISGLLLEDINSSLRIRRFYIRRFFKIVPQYVLVVLCGFAMTALLPLGHDGLLQPALSYAFLYQNYVHPLPALSHLWSIAVEEHFYFVYPFLLWAVFKMGRGSSARRKILVGGILVLIAAVFWIRRYTFIHFPYNALMLFQMTHLRFDALLFGCLIKLAEPFLADLPAQAKKIFSTLAFVGSLGVFGVLYRYFDPCRSSGYVLGYGLGGLLLVSALCGFAPLLAVTEHPAVRWIGRSSYAIYLWHYLIVYGARTVWKQDVTFGNLAMILILSLASGIISTITVERYFLNVRKTVAP